MNSLPSATPGPDDTAESAKPGAMLGGRFVLRERLGRGAVGTVFSALDTQVGQKVALKVLHPELIDHRSLERLRREVRACRPGHPNVVAIYDLHQDDGLRFLSLELVEGESLRDRLAQGSPPDVESAVSVGRQVAAALDHLHRRGVVHRDVKPGNILLAEDGMAKLCDMGLARPMAEGMTVTETEMVVGTPAYMAPEQALAGELTAASDVYALGLTLYQCLTGEVPLQEDTAVATLMLRQKSRPPRLRELAPKAPAWLDRLLRRMLDPEPGRRPTAAEVERALAEERVRIRIRPRRRQVVAAAILASVATAGGFGLRAFWERPASVVEVEGQDVVGYDSGGDELWRRSFPQSLIEVQEVDLHGDGEEEVLVVGRLDVLNQTLSEEPLESGITILSRAGEPITGIVPEQMIGSWEFTFRLEVTPALYVLDTDGDGVSEVLAVCRQRRYFPTVVLAYWPRWDVWTDVLHHPGFLYHVFPTAERSSPGFGFLALNNQLAMLPVVGLVGLDQPDERPNGIEYPRSGLASPPHTGLANQPDSYWIDYVPFASPEYRKEDLTPRMAWTEDGGLDVALNGMSARLDRWLNPVDGPNAGVDLFEMRDGFFHKITLVRKGVHGSSMARVEQIRDEIWRDYGPLLRDRAYRVIAVDAVARAFAVVGGYETAAAILQAEYERWENDDIGFLAANLQALAGDLDAAAASFERLMNQGNTQRARFDAPRALLRVAMESRDRALFRAGVEFLNMWYPMESGGPRTNAAFWATARLWWDESTASDADVGSADFVEEGDAVACLVRWRRGESRPDDVEVMRRFIVTNPESAGIGRSALVASLIARGEFAVAIRECDEAPTNLQIGQKTSFADYQDTTLISALRTVAILDSGDRELARKEALRLSEELDPELLPGILVAEVLAATE
ncbi:MAG: serine/threonine-protein kinase [Thermoanaerobaculales bacterium]|jgi:tRNA A-37 threonylcarbamoyl transferase component Bud32|nr:serine/threonine-protein kinase [Thermoanaerobaculales bacterium]